VSGSADAANLLARCTFPPAGTQVTCAVSGGADSLALLVLAATHGCTVTAVHVDHGLRTESAQEAALVEAAAARFGARFRAVRAPVEPGPNLEARARAARYAQLPPDALTGHTADDQAETMLLNLLRGAGPGGMAGMQRDRHPLLGLRRHETRALCVRLGLEPADDPSNRDPGFRRNRVRHELIPLLDEIAERDVAAILARQADLFRDDSAILDAFAAAIDPTDARAISAAPPALGRRAVRQWLTGDHPPDRSTIERVLAVARGDVLACEVGEGRRVERHHQRLVLRSQ
jgi:tRNA(Ile)-lysidine synthase